MRRIKDSGLIFHQLLCKMLHTKSQVDVLFSDDMGRRHWRSFLWGLQGTPARGQYKCICLISLESYVSPCYTCLPSTCLETCTLRQRSTHDSAPKILPEFWHSNYASCPPRGISCSLRLFFTYSLIVSAIFLAFF